MSTTATLADLAIRFPAASRVFARHGLDYCCGGRRSLTDAARDQGLDAEVVLREIEAEQRPPEAVDWRARALDELMAHIVRTHHAFLRGEMPDLVRLAEKVEQRHAGKEAVPAGLSVLLGAMLAEVLDHMRKEEQILFPMILAGQGHRAAGPVHVMEVEHDDVRRGLARIRELTGNLEPPAHACTSWRSLYLRLGALERDFFEHIHLENNILFPRALAA